MGILDALAVVADFLSALVGIHDTAADVREARNQRRAHHRRAGRASCKS